MPFVPITDAASFGKMVNLRVTPENRFLEFKAAYGPGPAQHEELARDIAQFANTDGGVLLIGVTESPVNGRRTAQGINPVGDVDSLKQWVEQAIKNYLSPVTFSHALYEVVLPQGSILAVNIPPSIHLVAFTSDDRNIQYLYRTDHGKQWFNPAEVERHIMNGSRAMQIRLGQLVEELRENDRVAVEASPKPLMWVGYPFGGHHTNTTVQLAPSQCMEFEVGLLVGRVCVRLPHGLIAEAWRTSDKKLGLYLKVTIIVTEDGQITFEGPVYRPPVPNVIPHIG